MSYTTTAAVIESSGIRPADLGFDTDPELEAFIDARLLEIDDLINAYTGRNFADEVTAGTITSVPAGVVGVARDMGRNAVAVAVASRQTPIVRVDEWEVRIADPRIFTPAHKEALNLYREKSPIIMFRVGGLPEATS